MLFFQDRGDLADISKPDNKPNLELFRKEGFDFWHVKCATPEYNIAISPIISRFTWSLSESPRPLLSSSTIRLISHSAPRNYVFGWDVSCDVSRDYVPSSHIDFAMIIVIQSPNQTSSQTWSWTRYHANSRKTRFLFLFNLEIDCLPSICRLVGVLKQCVRSCHVLCSGLLKLGVPNSVCC